MAIEKLTEAGMRKIGVGGADNILTGTPEANKRIFDNLPVEIGKKVNEVIDAVNNTDSALSGHSNRKDNPHNVTKGQVGLGNVDNTADKDKPVSDAVRVELETKADKSELETELAKKVDEREMLMQLSAKADDYNFRVLEAEVKEMYSNLEIDKKLASVTIPIDDALDATSENPVQNKAVAEAITSAREEAGNIFAGRKTERGEIFNDYDNNRALYTNNHAEGANTTAGFTGYKMLKVTANGTSSIDIEVRDKDLTKKASSAYAVGDKINFEAQLHWAEIAKINSFSTSADGNTVINVTYFTQHGLDASDDEAENWLSVTGKEGGEPIAQYHSAHAEGEGTIAAGRSGHAEGRDTRVVGNHGHAEGRSTKAGYCAHAEGKGAEALADASHAEGNSKATGMRAHAENSNTEARGAYSHSEGLHTVAASGSQHVQGKYNEIDSSDKYAHIVGGGTGTAEKDRKNIHTLDWNGSGWFAGDVTVGENKDKLATKAELDAGLKVKANIGTTLKDYGITDSAGLKTASGEIFNDYTNNKAIAPYTHAEGDNTLAGRKTFKVYSVDGNKLKLDSVKGLESGDIVSYSTYVSGESVLNPGWASLNDVAAIDAIDAVNRIITLTKNVDSGLSNETIENYGAGASGLWVNKKPDTGTGVGSTCAHAEGRRTKATGYVSHAEGNETVASGVYAHAEGNGSIASGETSHAEGVECLARGLRSHAEGWRTEARGSYSHAEGWNTVAKGDAQHVEGVANEEMDSNYLHIVGNGSVVIKDGVKTVNRSNAYTLNKSGDGWYAGTVEASGIILRSANKKFLLTVDDEGILKATEVK